MPPPVRDFMEREPTFIVERDFGTLVQRMNALTGDNLLDPLSSSTRSAHAIARSTTSSPRTRK